MTLAEELLPATQHYALLAVATALYTFIVVNGQITRPNRSVFISLGAVGGIPIIHMGWTTIGTVLSGDLSCMTNVSLLLHTLAIAAVIPIATTLAIAMKKNSPKRPMRIEPSVALPQASKSEPS